MVSWVVVRSSFKVSSAKETGVRHRHFMGICSSNGEGAMAPTMANMDCREEGSSTMVLADSSRPMRKELLASPEEDSSTMVLASRIMEVRTEEVMDGIVLRDVEIVDAGEAPMAEAHPGGVMVTTGHLRSATVSKVR